MIDIERSVRHKQRYFDRTEALQNTSFFGVLSRLPKRFNLAQAQGSRLEPPIRDICLTEKKSSSSILLIVRIVYSLKILNLLKFRFFSVVLHFKNNEDEKLPSIRRVKESIPTSLRKVCSRGEQNISQINICIKLTKSFLFYAQVTSPSILT